MKKISAVALSVSLAATGAFFATQSFGQEAGSNVSGHSQSASTTKAQRKAARKNARAKKNAELKKLEDAGYNPAKTSDSNYPQDLQDAQKKAGAGTGASQ